MDWGFDLKKSAGEPAWYSQGRRSHAAAQLCRAGWHGSSVEWKLQDGRGLWPGRTVTFRVMPQAGLDRWGWHSTAHRARLSEGVRCLVSCPAFIFLKILVILGLGKWISCTNMKTEFYLQYPHEKARCGLERWLSGSDPHRSPWHTSLLLTGVSHCSVSLSCKVKVEG